MMTSMMAGVTGLRNHQTRMDVIGNNIANVNTVAFKASRVVFQDMFSQTIRAASGPTDVNGGNNANQVGVGMQLANVDVLHTRTSSTYTGAPLDSSIAGDGYYVVGDGTKAPVLDPPVTGEIAVNDVSTFNYTRAGNFYIIDNMLLDSNGLFVQKIAVNDAGVPIGQDGQPLGANEPYVYQNIEIDKKYTGVQINANGEIVGLDGENRVVIATIALANFENNNGLEKVGNNLYRQSSSSGTAEIGKAGENGTGILQPGMLEMSNVDLANEFTNMIITQRGFQANSRIITTSDTMLEELVNLKR
ncbi:flagellar hook-basal body complex protein [Eubacteriales bacterium OttesenSCG-928-N14]|nr:flagellar hook-basal body complex protein [Eubacteriales bacterium OttesenSCG-928-N14]